MGTSMSESLGMTPKPQLIVGGVFQGYNSFFDQAEMPALTGKVKTVSGPTAKASVTICASFSEYLKSINVDVQDQCHYAGRYLFAAGERDRARLP